MEYIVVPFNAVITRNANGFSTPLQPQPTINRYSAERWEYVRPENIIPIIRVNF